MCISSAPYKGGPPSGPPNDPPGAPQGEHKSNFKVHLKKPFYNAPHNVHLVKVLLKVHH